jgi:ketosteroid isomerase-like protein
MAHPNETLIGTFYKALGRRDPGTMIACYAPTIVFRDPVFQLQGERVGAMWHMLCERGRDLRVTAAGIAADDREGVAEWEAWYTFSATGRPVHNRISARFRFEDGKIVRHDDRFSLHGWAAQALGLQGRLLGWSPMMHSAIRRKAARGLEAYLRGAAPAR